MLRTIFAALAVVVCLSLGDARPAGPPPRPNVPLERQLEFARSLLLAEYKLAGSGKDRYVVELRFSLGYMNEELPRLATFDRLERLDLSSCNLGDDDLEHIVRLRSLRSLDLSGSFRITDAGACRLATMPLLESLDLTGTWVGAVETKGVVSLGVLRNLKRLRCDYISDAGLLALARCHKLESLDFQNGEISEKGARAFASMPRIKHLALGSCKLAPNGQPHLRRLVGLQSLRVGTLTDAGFDAVISLPLLEEFSFRDASDAALAKIANMKAIKRIGGSGDDHFLEAVSRCKTVESIWTFDETFTDAGLARLARLPALRKLELFRSSVTDSGVAQLARCPALRELSLDQTKVTDACVPSLIKMKSLRQVSLRHSKVTKEGYERLRKARPDLTIEIYAYWKGVPND